MKIVKLKAGLGNQMFQYAFCKLLEKEYDCSNVLIDLSYYKNKSYRRYLDMGLNLLSVSYEAATKKDLHRIGVIYNGFKPHHFFHRATTAVQTTINKNYYFEKNRSYVDVQSILRYSYFDGYWQSWKYLDPIRGILIKDFVPRSGLSDKSLSYISQYSSDESVFIGIRKGDYNQSAKSTSHYGVPSKDYYSKSINLMLERLRDPLFVVFSDDIEWVKENFDFCSMGVREGRIAFRDEDSIYNDFEELFIMASCKHAIISNSTFNFWGAWLIENTNKIVVAPKEWFKDGKPIDIIPPEWIQI